MFHSLMKQLLLHKMRSPNDRFVRELRDIAVPVKSGRWVIKASRRRNWSGYSISMTLPTNASSPTRRRSVARSALKGGVTC